MKNWVTHFLWGMLAFLLVAPPAQAQKSVYTAEQLPPAEKALLWKISGNGLSKPSYLFGTIHMIPKDDLNFSEPLLKALEKTKRITFEIDMKEMTSIKTQFSLITKAFMKDGRTLRDLMSAEDYTFVHKKLAEKGMDAAMFEKLKPMFLAMMLSDDSEGMQENASMTSVEMELYHISKKKKIPSAGLETVAFQMSIFDSISYEDQAKMLLDALKTESGADNEFDRMLQMYREQDINAMQALIQTEGQDVASFEDRLLNDRNRNWVPVMGRMMAEKPTFFAVGAGHLGGPNGVIALLRKEGYLVEAVPMETP